jgi:SAM-dependent methyltransferase
LKNKNHWYDGLFYDLLVAPNQDTTFELVEQLILPGSSILDVGCGTGRFAFRMRKNYGKIDGVDLSERNIRIAEKKRNKLRIPDISFYHDDVLSFLARTRNTYDYAVLSYMIHEVNKEQRNKILRQLTSHTEELIIADYNVPVENGLWSSLNRVVEFAAGKDHYNNFKSFVASGGIAGAAAENGLKITKEIKNIPATSHIAILKKEK